MCQGGHVNVRGPTEYRPPRTSQEIATLAALTVRVPCRRQWLARCGRGNEPKLRTYFAIIIASCSSSLPPFPVPTREPMHAQIIRSQLADGSATFLEVLDPGRPLRTIQFGRRGSMNRKTSGYLVLPDAWRRAAGAETFKPNTAAYKAAPTALTLPLELIRPPKSAPDATGLREERSLSLLRAIVSGKAMPPIQVARAKDDPRKFVVIDGYHRYYLSLAIGFLEIPVQILAGK